MRFIFATLSNTLLPSNLESNSQWSNATPVVQGHYSKNLKWNNEVWGLTTIPNSDNFLSCSDDGTLRMWSISKRKCVVSKDLNLDNKGVKCGPDPKTKDLQDCSKLRSIGCHPSGNYAAVGSADGTVKFVSLAQNVMTWKASFKSHSKWVQDIKFSPDGSKFATGAHDAFVDIYSTNPFKRLYHIKKHSSAVLHIDWSLDSNTIHTNCQAYELLFL